MLSVVNGNGTLPSPRVVESSADIRPIRRDADGYRYFSSDEAPFSLELPSRPLKICVITSVRDIGGDDRSGATIDIEGRPTFMRGSLHGLLDACGNELRGYAEVTRILIDDIPGYKCDEQKMCHGGLNYTAMPELGKLWIVPPDYVNPDGIPLRDLVDHLPSDFRARHRDDPERVDMKRRWEEAIAESARRSGADIILSDHCMALFRDLHRTHFPGAVVNIHPAITWEGDPNKLRGASPTKEAIERAASGGYARTGSSFHFIADNADDGPVIVDAERTPVFGSMSPERLRLENYRCSKIPVLVRGLQVLASNFDRITQPMRVAMMRPAEQVGNGFGIPNVGELLT